MAMCARPAESGEGRGRDLTYRSRLERHPQRELKRSRIANRRDLIERWQRIGRIRPRTEIGVARQVVATIREVERFDRCVHARARSDPERSAHTHVR